MSSLFRMPLLIVLAVAIIFMASSEMIKNTLSFSESVAVQATETTCPDVHHDIKLESSQPSHGCHSVCLGKMPASKAQLASLQQAFALALISRDQSVKAFSMNESLFRPPISTFV
ncbi:hypothetical protein WFH56_19835 [Vibrio vulnificus]|uniref:hypothetical protein n=1 Tax=Vibrio vulnificus TaxID=672 RepID=UPI001EEC6908|nr:hypothetical protein [Vibrio vulnificus]MCG6304602.1 hypothetical protein [Vibrio vulnificus]